MRKWVATALIALIAGGGSLLAIESASAADKDCADFAYQEDAQAYFDAGGGSPSYNFNGLDADRDGIACESLPHRPGPPPPPPPPPPCTTPGSFAVIRFIEQAYRDFLDREASGTESGYWGTKIECGLSRASFVDTLATSDEWVRTIVNGFYADTLGRAGEAGGVSFWSGQIRSRQLTVAAVAANFYSSDEYFRNIGGNANASWIGDLYAKLMFRVPSDTEVGFWVGQITSGSMNRLQVASFFYGSIEKRRLRVSELYEKILNRTLPTTDSGFVFWADWLQTHDDIDLAVVLATTGSEYFDKAQTPH